MESNDYQLEKFKFRLNIKQMLIDKLALAVVLVLLGYLLNHFLESYKAALLRDTEAFKADLTKSIEEYKIQQQREIEKLKLDQNRESDNLKLQNEWSIEMLRIRQQQENENLRTSLGFQGGLADRRLRAYEAVWLACVDFGISFSKAKESRSDSRQALDSAVQQLQKRFSENLFYLDESTEVDIRRILGRVANLSDFFDSDAKFSDAMFKDAMQDINGSLFKIRQRAFNELSPSNVRDKSK